MKYLTSKLFKKHFLFFILIPLVFIVHSYTLRPHLNLGFDDTADQYTSQFRQIREMHPSPFQFLIKTLDGGIPLLWVHEYYYMGILNNFFGDNFLAYHQTAHFFKSLSVLSTYPLFFVLTGSGLVAFISSFIFAISYTSAGSLEPVVVNGDYIGIINLSIFLTIYFYLMKKGFSSKIRTYFIGLFFLVLTLIVATTRTYPVVFIILATEIFMIIRNRSLKNFKLVGRRLLVFLLPILLVILFKPGPIIERVNAISLGMNEYFFSGKMYELLLVPFLNFSSIFLPLKFWSYLTIVIAYLFPFIFGFLLSKKPLRFTLISISILTAGLLFINWAWSTSSSQNFVELKTKTPMAFIFLGLSIAFFLEWIQTKNKIYIGLFLGPLLSFIFIFSTWLLTQERGIFTDIHRYLTVASIFTSLFIGSLIVTLYKRFQATKFLKFFSFIFFLLIPIYLVISSNAIQNFYDERFKNGFTLKDQDEMRRKLLPYLSDIRKPRLIYIDMSLNDKNTYYSQIFRYGPLYWLFWYDKSVTDDKIPRSILDYNLLSSSVSTQDGERGVLFQSNFYRTEDFRAVKVINRDLIDIKDQVMKDLEL